MKLRLYTKKYYFGFKKMIKPFFFLTVFQGNILFFRIVNGLKKKKKDVTNIN